MKKISFAMSLLIGVSVITYLILRPSGAEAPPVNTFQQKNSDTESNRVKSPQASSDVSGSVHSKVSRKDNEGNEFVNHHAQNRGDVSIGSFLVSDGDKNTLNTEQLSDLSVNKLRSGIANLDYDGNKDNLAFETEYKLERKLNEIPGMVSDTVRCSNSICGLLFSGENENRVMSTLDQLSRDKEISSVSGGGFLRHFEENGTHYGVIVLTFDKGRPLSIH